MNRDRAWFRYPLYDNVAETSSSSSKTTMNECRANGSSSKTNNSNNSVTNNNSCSLNGTVPPAAVTNGHLSNGTASHETLSSPTDSELCCDDSKYHRDEVKNLPSEQKQQR